MKHIPDWFREELERSEADGEYRKNFVNRIKDKIKASRATIYRWMSALRK